jgi:hypothetical protein
VGGALGSSYSSSHLGLPATTCQLGGTLASAGVPQQMTTTIDSATTIPDSLAPHVETWLRGAGLIGNIPAVTGKPKTRLTAEAALAKPALPLFSLPHGNDLGGWVGSDACIDRRGPARGERPPAYPEDDHPGVHQSGGVTGGPLVGACSTSSASVQAPFIQPLAGRSGRVDAQGLLNQLPPESLCGLGTSLARQLQLPPAVGGQSHPRKGKLCPIRRGRRREEMRRWATT